MGIKNFSMTVLFFVVGLITIQGQKNEHIRVGDGGEMHFCPFSSEVSDHYVPARKTLPYKNTSTRFEVSYSGDIPNEAVIAFEDGALSVISNLINSEVVVRIDVSWEQREEGNLASASANGFYQGGLLSPRPDEVFPVALYEKIVRTNVNGDNADILVFINSDVDWHYNFQSSNTNGKMDFVSTMIHEVFHGLGFVSGAGYNEENMVGAYNVWDDATRHDVFAEYMRSGTLPLGQISDFSLAMGQAFTNSNLFFEDLSGERYELYAPLLYETGSSVSHLDQSRYANTESSMMTPSLSPGKIERDPGVALDIMFDMGWDMIHFLHEAAIGKEEFDEDQKIEVEIIADSDLDPGSLMFHYSLDSFKTKITNPLELNTSTGLYEAVLPAPNEEATYQYYFEASNSRNRTLTGPGNAPEFYYDFKYLKDVVPPFILHVPVSELNSEETLLHLEANVTDTQFGVDSVYVEWTINGVPQVDKRMSNRVGFDGALLDDDYEADLIFLGGPLNVGDVVSYFIFAVDKSNRVNKGTYPLRGGAVTISVSQVAAAVVRYVNDFEEVTNDFSGNGFNTLISSGFLSTAINSTHPYPEAGANNFLNLIYRLEIPITLVAENPLIEFDEVVLVEPGEPNTSFGDDDFWDYVIVEAQKSGTTEWIPLLDGYDSDADPAWRSKYNSSPLTATSTLYKPRVIDITNSGDFSAGDKIIIRFRLFSDPAVNAWGWAIDNLVIQDVQSAVSDFVVEEEVVVFPNPSNEDVYLQLKLLKPEKNLKAVIVDIQGREVMRRDIATKGSNYIKERFDISNLSDGIYFLNVYFTNDDVLTRKIIKD
ncbi:MAG: hypothetical protein ACI9FN_001892 [Saprospiraceae bacterium]|jgi:hypothetical protein